MPALYLFTYPLISQASQEKSLHLCACVLPLHLFGGYREAGCTWSSLGLNIPLVARGRLPVSQIQQVVLAVLQATLPGTSAPSGGVSRTLLTLDQLFSSVTPECLKVMYLRLAHHLGLNVVQPDQFLKAASQKQRQSPCDLGCHVLFILGYILHSS